MASRPQSAVHFRDAVEHLHLIDTHFLLHPQLISSIYASGIACKGFKQFLVYL